MEGEGRNDEGAEGSGTRGERRGLQWKEKVERIEAARTGAGCIGAGCIGAVKI